MIFDTDGITPGPNDKFRQVQVFTDVENRGMEIWFCKLEGFNGVITEIEQKVFIPESDLTFISEAATRVSDELRDIRRT